MVSCVIIIQVIAVSMCAWYVLLHIFGTVLFDLTFVQSVVSKMVVVALVER